MKTNATETVRLTAIQLNALRALAKIEEFRGQSNWYIQAVKALRRRGLVSERYEGYKVITELTDAGRQWLCSSPLA